MSPGRPPAPVRWAAEGASWTSGLVGTACLLAFVLLVSGGSARKWAQTLRGTVLAERRSIETLWGALVRRVGSAAGAYGFVAARERRF